MKHFIYSADLETDVISLNEFDKNLLLTTIVNHLSNYPDDMLTHEKEFTPEEKRKYVGRNVINVYEINPKSGKPSLCFTKGNKTFYKDLH